MLHIKNFCDRMKKTNPCDCIIFRKTKGAFCMKIKPVKNPKIPEYPTYEQLSKKKDGKKALALISAVSMLGAMTGCQAQTTGDVQWEGVASPEIVETSLAGDVDVDGAVAIETTEEVQLMGEVAVDWISYDVYEFTEDGNYTATATNQGDYVTELSYTLSDGESTLNIYKGEFDIFSKISVSELRENKFFNISYSEDYYELYSTTDGDVIVLSPDRCDYDIVIGESVTLAGDVVAPDDNTCTVPTESCDTELAGSIAIVTTDGE